MSACAGILGIEDGHLRADGGVGEEAGAHDATTGGDGSPSGGDDDATVTGDDGSPVEGDDSSPPVLDAASCDPSATVDPTGVFVRKGGDDQATCSMTNPCATIGRGVAAAHDLFGATQSPVPVYVAAGSYQEQLTLQAGVVVIGGWSSSWTRACAPTVIQAPPTVPVTVIANYQGSATLSSVVIESEPSSDAKPGESLIGILASGQSTALKLEFIQVSMAAAGDGLPGNAGDAGTVPPVCATPGDAGSSDTVAAKGTGADAGWFVATGFASMNGGMGTVGGAGANGSPGGAGACVQCVTACQALVTCTATNGAVICGDAGLPGCGGGGGGGGFGGQTGGSSVALLVAGANVLHASSTLQAGNGGNGGPGGPGGEGASGAGGLPGAPSATCNTSCSGLLGCGFVTGYADGGAAGGAGGKGGVGGPGGDGAGGDSYAVVVVGGASVFASEPDGGPSNLYPGLPGSTPDGGNGAPGRAGKTLSQ